MHPQDYQTKGIKRLLKYKELFHPAHAISKNIVAKKTAASSKKEIDDFVNIFCEHQLADNDYMNIHLESNLYKSNSSWFENLSQEKVLKLMTYIIWTDKFVDGYLASSISDGTLHQLLNRLDILQTTTA